MSLIDTQVHLIDPARYPFPDPPAGYLPKAHEIGTLDALLETMDQHGIARAVLVPASVYGADNTIMLDAFRNHPHRFRVIAGVGSIDDVARVAQHNGVVGVRLNLVNSKPIKTSTADIARAIVDHNLVLQLQASPTHINALIGSIGRSEAHVVLDHFGRPDLAGDAAQIDQLGRLAAMSAVYIKASAAFRMLSTTQASISDTRALSNLLQAFGKDRVLWGSDWPFINTDQTDLSYRQTMNLMYDLVGDDWQTAANVNAATLFGWRT